MNHPIINLSTTNVHPSPKRHLMPFISPAVYLISYWELHNLKPLLHPRAHSPQIVINLARRLTQDQTDNTLPGNMYISKTAQNVYFAVGEYDSGFGSVFDCEFCFSVFACYTADGAGHVVALKCFDVFDFEGFDVKVVCIWSVW